MIYYLAGDRGLVGRNYKQYLKSKGITTRGGNTDTTNYTHYAQTYSDLTKEKNKTLGWTICRSHRPVRGELYCVSNLRPGTSKVRYRRLNSARYNVTRRRYSRGRRGQ